MADDCCNSFGGRVSITIDGKRFAPTDAHIVLDTANTEVEGMANQDGSAAYISKPKLFGAEITLRGSCGVTWNADMRKCAVDVTIEEEDNNRTHIFTGARVVGSPRENISNGEISGLRIAGDRYQRLPA